MELRREPLHLFEGYGIELEYMLVNERLDVLPVADRLLVDAQGAVTNEIDAGEIALSNELALHVLEFKTNGPAPELGGLAEAFQKQLRQVNERLVALGGRLLPTAMHPWMDPLRQTRLWPHGNREIYRAYDRIFKCQGHGWANLQSMHINLPFAGDEEFGRLHAAIRVLLPMLPALAASSPLMEGRFTGIADNRLDVYRRNQRRVPAICGRVIPEGAFSQAQYLERILAPMYRQISPYDPDGILQEEWLNSRGAIARFERGAIEIRLLDLQECPAADIAVADLVISVLRALVEERWSSWEAQKGWTERSLASLLEGCIRDADAAPVDDIAYLELFGLGKGAMRASDFWQALSIDREGSLLQEGAVAAARRVILEKGPMTRRIERALSAEPKRSEIHEVYGEIAEALERGEPFAL